MDSYSLIKTTFKSKSDVKKFSKLLFENKLIASVQVNEIASSYMWKNDLVSHKEFEATFFTKSSLFTKIEELCRTSHPYETPQLIQINIDKISNDFAKWIDEYTS